MTLIPLLGNGGWCRGDGSSLIKTGQQQGVGWGIMGGEKWKMKRDVMSGRCKGRTMPATHSSPLKGGGQG